MGLNKGLRPSTMTTIKNQETTPLNDPVAEVRRWLEEAVIGWNLCPFARKELASDRVRFALSEADSEEALLRQLIEELDLLDSSDEIETTLLIHPNVLGNFDDYNQFLDYADGLLDQLDRVGVYQIASFHPHYQFADTDPEDQENFTNRSPYPLLHILREQSLTEAIDRYPDVDGIPQRNIDFMRNLSPEEMTRVFG